MKFTLLPIVYPFLLCQIKKKSNVAEKLIKKIIVNLKNPKVLLLYSLSELLVSMGVGTKKYVP